MYLGIISDTHGDVRRTFDAILAFKEWNVSRIIHCGDIGTTEVVRLFREIPTDFVLGNCDGSGEVLREAILQTGQTCHGVFGSMTLADKKIAFLHGHQQQRFDREIESGHWDLICYGHTHHAEFSLVGKTYCVNPGALYRVATPSVAVIRLPEMELTKVPL